MNRLIPEIPPKDAQIRLLIDSDAANEIDDLYAIALALTSPARFKIEGFVATHFAAAPDAGPESIDKSYATIETLLEKAGQSGAYPVARGGHPMQYERVPSESEGCELILEKARQSTPADPLWVLGLGAATNLASAVLKDPSIKDRVRYIFHARSEHTWPTHTVQYNVRGDVLAAMTLLSSGVPLVWFDTGTYITASCEETERWISGAGELGAYLHAYRSRSPYFMSEKKGFFDLGDIAFLIAPEICRTETVKVMKMDRNMTFSYQTDFGEMLRVSDIDRHAPWQLLENALRSYHRS